MQMISLRGNANDSALLNGGDWLPPPAEGAVLHLWASSFQHPDFLWVFL